MTEFDESLLEVKKVNVLPGVGIEGWVLADKENWKHVCVGNEKIMKSNGGRCRPNKTSMTQINEFVNLHQSKKHMVLFISVDDNIEKVISLAGNVVQCVALILYCQLAA